MYIQINGSVESPQYGNVCVTHLRYDFGGFQVYATHVYDVWRDWSRRFGDVMTVLEDYGRVDCRRQIIRSRVCELGDQLVVPSLGYAVRQQRRVHQPLNECAGHCVAGKQVGHASRVGHVAGKHPLGEDDHRRRDRVNHGQTERVAQIRNAVKAHWLN